MKRFITAISVAAVMALSVVPAFAVDEVYSPKATKPCPTLSPSKCYNSPKTGDAFNETAVYSVIGFSALACGGAAVALAKTSKKK